MKSNHRSASSEAAIILTVVAILVLVVVGFSIVGTGVWAFGASVVRQETHDGSTAMGSAAAVVAPQSSEKSLYLYRIGLAHREWSASQMIRAEEILDQCPEQLRSWEWRYLKRLCHSELLSFPGHPRGGRAVAFSPDGKHVASTDYRSVKVWEASTGKELLTLSEHQGRVAAVAFSPDGRRIASAGFKTIKVWDAKTGDELLAIAAHELLITGLAFSPDGTRLVSSSRVQKKPGQEAAGEIKTWDAKTGEELSRTAEVHWVNSVQFSPDGQWIASGSGNLGNIAPARPGSLKVWDATTGKEVFDLRGHSFWITSVAFSPDVRLLASASADKTVKVWDLESGTERFTLHGHTGWVRCVLFTPKGDQIVSAGDDQTVMLWDAKSGRQLASLRGPIGRIEGLAISPNGNRLVTATRRRVTHRESLPGQTGAVKVWNITDDQMSTVYRGHSNRVTSVAFSPDGRYLASSSRSYSSAQPGEVIVQDAGTGHLIHRLPGHLMGYTEVAFMPDSKVLVALGGEGVKQWDVVTGQPQLTMPIRVHPIRALAIGPDGSRIAAGGTTVWDVPTGMSLFKTAGHTIASHVTALAFSPDGLHLSSANWGGYLSRKVDGKRETIRARSEVIIWNGWSGKELRTLDGGGQGVAYSPDGRLLASGDAEGVVTLFDVESGTEILSMRGHTKAVTSVAFSPDGKRIASSSRDQTAKVWDVETGLETFCLHGHTEAVTDLAFSPDGHRLATSSDDGTVRFWDGSPLR